MDPDPIGDKADHIRAVSVATTDPMYQSSPESYSEGGREVYMVGNGEQPSKETAKEVQQEAEEEIAHAAHLVKQEIEQRSTMTCRTTRESQKMSLGMVPPRGDTTRSLIHDARQTGIDSRTGHDQSRMRWVGSSIRASKSTAGQHKMLWPQGCSVIPRSKKTEMKPPSVCPACLNHTYNNNMINMCHVR
jgi:hypothetical protein